MGQNAALKKLQLDDLLFSQSEIENTVTKREHIFELKKDNSSLGFISLYDLKEYLNLFESSDNNASENFEVRNIDQENFQNIFEHPLFQRRKPQIVTPNLEENMRAVQEFHILQNGQKSGPFNKQEIEKYLSNNEMIMSDMISLNAGQTWVKVYSVPDFERRELSSSISLPRFPDNNLIKQGPADLRNINDGTEATSSLAYFGNLKKSKVGNLDFEQMDKKEIQHNKAIGNGYKWLFAFCVIGIGYFIYNIRSALKSPLGDTQVPRIGEHIENVNGIETGANLDSSPRQSGKMNTRNLRPVRPRNRGSQKSFNESNPGALRQDNPDPNYYFDNSSPMELDPVREQVSKETFENTPGEPGTPPADDALFNQESSN
jgi:hypothetical protein